MKIFRFAKKVFFIGLTILSTFTNVNSLSCISMNNQECKIRPQFVNVNGDEPVFFPFGIETSKCSGSCNNKLVDKLVDECTEMVEEVKLAKITLAENENSYKCSSCTVYTVLFWIFFTINVGGIGAYFVYFHGYLKKMFTRETTIY